MMPTGAFVRGRTTTVASRTRAAVWLELCAVEPTLDPREEARTRSGRLVRLSLELGLERTRHADAVLVHREPLVRLRFGERPSARAGSTRPPRTRAGDRAPNGTRLASPRRSRRPWTLRPAVCARIRGSVEYRLTPKGTTHTVESSGKRSRMPTIVSSSTAPSLMPGQTTT